MSDFVSLVKEAGVSLKKAGLTGQTSRVAGIIDISGSMQGFYDSGVMQQIVERVLADTLDTTLIGLVNDVAVPCVEPAAVIPVLEPYATKPPDAAK